MLEFDEFDHLDEESEQQARVIAQFAYRDLDGFFFPGRNYTRKLQEYAKQQDELIAIQEGQIYDLEKKLAKTGNQYYQKDAGKWGKAWTDLNIKYGQLHAEKIASEAKLQAEIDRLRYQLQQVQMDLEAAESRNAILDQPVPEDSKITFLPNRNPDGTFKTVPKTKEQLAGEYHRQGLKKTEIAEMLGVSPDTVARYIRKCNQAIAESEKIKAEEMRLEEEKKENERWENFEAYGFTFS